MEKYNQNESLEDLAARMKELNFNSSYGIETIAEVIKHLTPPAERATVRLPEDIKASIRSVNAQSKRFHGAKLPLPWFPKKVTAAPCADKFGYLTSDTVRASSKLAFNVVNQALLGELGNLMGNAGSDTAGDSPIPAGYTYFGQFVDHDITLDISSTFEAAVDAGTINNMRTPALDLESLYGGGPGLEPYLFVFPDRTSPFPTAIKFQLGSNRDEGPGGPSDTNGSGGMRVQTQRDVPRSTNFTNPALSTNTAIIGDPRNDENLIVSQFHVTMLVFHNKVVDLLILAAFPGDIFVEAKKIVTQHYQWAIINDYLVKVCGAAAVSDALLSVTAAVGSPFSMPVEFSVAAYRFGHSQIRNSYWVTHLLTGESLMEIFSKIRNPNLPVSSRSVVNFNAFFRTPITVPVFNNARKIDSMLSNGLESLPDFTGIMSVLAIRNLRRALAFGLPSGQATATALGVPVMSSAELTSGLNADELTVLNSNGGVLLNKTPLWYYILREAAVLSSGDQLGPLGAKIVAETFVRMLKRDSDSYLNVTGGFSPILPSQIPGTFDVADITIFSGINLP